MIEWTNENIRDLKVGDTFYHFQNSHVGRKFYKTHILAIIDEDKEDVQVVFKWFGKCKQYWHYEIKPMDVINSSFDCGMFAGTEIELRKNLAK
jgi:hypothetical protein